MDLISRCELFNRLATIQAETANEMKAEIYAVIQSMPAADEEEEKMKQTYTLDEVRNLAVGAYSEGYCAVYEENPLYDEGFDSDDIEQVDALICRYTDTEEKTTDTDCSWK